LRNCAFGTFPVAPSTVKLIVRILMIICVLKVGEMSNEVLESVAQSLDI
jgi:hypothetical protein